MRSLFQKEGWEGKKSIVGLDVEISRKRIKNMYLRVNPRTKKIRITAPTSVTDQRIEEFVRSRQSWIKRQLAKELPPDKPQLRYEAGELHPFAGTDFVLRIVETSSKRGIEIADGEMRVYAPKNASAAAVKKIAEDGYRGYLKAHIPELIEKWEPVIGVRVNEFGIKKMKTRWGTCNIKVRRIWLNLELAKYRPESMEYVVVHEMVHLLERSHNKRFYEFMDRFLPDWKQRKNTLNGKIC